MERKDRHKVTANSVFFFGARIIDVISGLLSNVLIARYLGTTQFGEYSFVISYSISILTLSYFGIEKIAVRDISKHMDKAEDYFGAAITARWVMSLLAGLLLLATLPFVDLKSHLFPALLLITVSELVGASASIFVSVFRAYEKIKYEIFVTVIWRVCTLVFISIMIFLNTGITGICAAIALAAVPRTVMSLWLVRRKFVKPSFSFDRRLLSGILRDAVVLGFSVLLTNWFLRSAQIGLQFMKGPEHVAFFQVAQSVVIQLSMIAMSISISMFPMISRQSKTLAENNHSLADIHGKTSRLLLGTGAFLAILMIVFSQEILHLLFGAEYAGAIPVLKILLISVVPLFIATWDSHFLIAFHMSTQVTAGRVITLLTAVLLYFLLIPGLDTIGAAWAFSIANIVFALSNLVFFKYSELSFIKWPLAKFSLYVFGSVFAALFIGDNMHIAARMLIAALLTAGLLYQFGGSTMRPAVKKV